MTSSARRLSSTAEAMRAMGGLIGELQATCLRSSAVERGAHNALAAGSNPAGSTNPARGRANPRTLPVTTPGFSLGAFPKGE